MLIAQQYSGTAETGQHAWECFCVKGGWVGVPSWGCCCCSSMANGVMISRTTPGLVGHTKCVWSGEQRTYRESTIQPRSDRVNCEQKSRKHAFYDQKSRPDKTFSPHAPHTPPRHSLMIKPPPRVLNTSLQR